MIIREKTIKYSTDDLIDKVELSLLSDESKSILIKLIEDISIQYEELYHQLSRQALTVNIYRQLKEIDNSFAQLVFNCLSSENTELFYTNKLIDKQINLLNSFKWNIQNVISDNVFEYIESVIDKCNQIYKLFSENCIGIVSNNQNIYDNNDSIDSLINYTQPKSFKYFINSELENNEEIDEVPLEDNQLTLSNNEDTNVRLVSLKKSGLKIKPIKTGPRVRIKRRYLF